MCALAHAIESAGIPTISLISIRSVAERMRPPRALYAEFPLGRPLGVPDDADFQHRVLAQAFGLLERRSGPVLEDFPEVIDGDAEPALSCPIPPRVDDGPPAVTEARALRSAYERRSRAAGRSNLGRVIDADGVAEALTRLDRIAHGESWKEVRVPGDPIQLVHDLRAYYEEASLELVGSAVGSGASEKWFFDETEAGRTILAARAEMKAQDAPFPMWFYMASLSR